MPTIELKEAVSLIKQNVADRVADDRPSPFFFVVGAGISYPNVPLAGRIEAECRDRATADGRKTPPPSNDPMDRYSHWFRQAFTSAERRQRYLQGLMDPVPVSKANLRLAHILLDGRVGRTVFTTNFDEMISKALQLFGHRPLVCDSPLTVGRLTIESPAVQVIHVHGSCRFYDCCNLTTEISERSGNGSLRRMLEGSLMEHSPLVVGYSGWERDIVMVTLREHLAARELRVPLYWFCHQRESVRDLPAWLTGNREVFCVVPAETPRSGLPLSDAGGDEARLRAESVLDEFVREFELKVPELVDNPLAFYARELRKLVGPTDSKETESDTFYSFHRVLERVEKARDGERRSTDALEPFREAMTKADYRGALALAGQLDLDKLSAKQLREIALGANDAAAGLQNDSDEEIGGYDLVVRASEALVRLGGELDAAVKISVAKALRSQGRSLGRRGRYEDAILVQEDLVRRLGDASEPEILEQLAGGLLAKSFALGGLSRYEEAVALCDEVLARCGDTVDPALLETVVKALHNKGLFLVNSGRSEEAVAVCDDLLRRLASDDRAQMFEFVANALVNKGYALGTLKRNEEALPVYEQVLERFGKASQPVIRQAVAIALVNKGIALDELDRSDDAIMSFDEVVHRFGDESDPGIREQVAKSFCRKGASFARATRYPEAIAIYDDLLHRFADETIPAIREQIAVASVNRIGSMFLVGEEEAAHKAYDEFVARFGSARMPTLRGELARALYVKGLGYVNLQKTELAISTFEDLLTRFGDASEPAVLDWVGKARADLERTKAQGAAGAEGAEPGEDQAG